MASENKPETEKQPVSILLEVPLYDGLRRIAALEHRTMAGELRRIIEAHIAAYDAREAA